MTTTIVFSNGKHLVPRGETASQIAPKLRNEQVFEVETKSGVAYVNPAHVAYVIDREGGSAQFI